LPEPQVEARPDPDGEGDERPASPAKNEGPEGDHAPDRGQGGPDRRSSRGGAGGGRDPGRALAEPAAVRARPADRDAAAHQPAGGPLPHLAQADRHAELRQAAVEQTEPSPHMTPLPPAGRGRSLSPRPAGPDWWLMLR